jgi:uncharacterized coiled-coil protein SlyX
MSTSDSDPSPIEQRVVTLEMLLTHLQRTVAELDGVVLEQATKVTSLERLVDMLTGRLKELTSSLPGESLPEDEKPPHY